MPALAQRISEELQSRAANDDRINGGLGTRTKYLYDANGNMTSRTGSSITWTSYNYPTSLSVPGGTATIQYGPNRQYLQTVMPHPAGGNTETIRYIGEAMERRARGTEVDWRHFVRIGSETVAIISRKSTGTNAVGYVLGDHQGSTAVLTSNTGSVLLNESYAAFGAARNAATWSGAVSTANQTTMADTSRHGYADHTMLGFGGLIHMNGRVQDSITGRFLSPDPYTTEPGSTQGYNRYAYVRNNPLTYIDPSGFTIVPNCYMGECPIVDQAGNAFFPTGTGWRDTCDFLCQLGRFHLDKALNDFRGQSLLMGAGAGTRAGESGGGEGEENTGSKPQSVDPGCDIPLSSALGRAGNAPATITEAVSRTQSELRAMMTPRFGLAPQPQAALSASLGMAYSRTRPGGTWATGQAEGNVQYGAVLTTLGVPIPAQLFVGDADETAEKLGLKPKNDNDNSWTDSPIAKAQIMAGTQCVRRQ
jgi:RHS repeat-associated protein